MITTKSTTGRIEGLELLRGFAVLCVILHHGWPYILGGGGVVGVVVFFGLSGYLITGVLMKDFDSGRRSIRYGHFYRNRALRLLPALVVMLGIFAAVEGMFDLLGDQDELLRSVIVGLTYTMNIPGFKHGSVALGHLWTLASEEQFYIVWPLILTLGVRTGRLNLLVILSALLCLALCGADIWRAYPHVEWIYSDPTSWAVVMMIGSAAYLWRDSVADTLSRSRYPRGALSIAALVVLLYIAQLPITLKNSALTYLVLGPLIGICTVVLIFHLREWKSLPIAWLRPLMRLGTISYAAYLWNYVMVCWTERHPQTQWQAISEALLTILAATLSWWLVERPFNQLKAYLDRRKPAPRTQAA